MVGGEVDRPEFRRKTIQDGHHLTADAGDGVLSRGGVSSDGDSQGCDVVPVAVGGKLALKEAVGVELNKVRGAVGDGKEVVDGVDGVTGGGRAVREVGYREEFGLVRGEVGAGEGVLGWEVGEVY